MRSPAGKHPEPPAVRARKAHALYCELTGQKLVFRAQYQRWWLGLLRLGFTLDDVRQVVRYLQKEIRHDRRNVGALKLSNLLQPERFEEDLNISRVRLQPPSRPPRSSTAPLPPTEPIDANTATNALAKLEAKLKSGHPIDPHEILRQSEPRSHESQ